MHAAWNQVPADSTDFSEFIRFLEDWTNQIISDNFISSRDCKKSATDAKWAFIINIFTLFIAGFIVNKTTKARLGSAHEAKHTKVN